MAKNNKTVIKKDTPLKEILLLAEPCDCKACNHGCMMGAGTLTKNQDKKIAEFLKIYLKEFRKKYLEKLTLLNKEVYKPKTIRKGKPYGKCIFFKNNKCSIHPVKPLECRIAMSCKGYGEDLMIWFMLNYVLDEKDPESIRQYASYLASGGKTISGGELEGIVPDKNRLKKILNRKV